MRKRIKWITDYRFYFYKSHYTLIFATLHHVNSSERSLSTLAVCNTSRRSPGTNPECEMRHSWERKGIKGTASESAKAGGARATRATGEHTVVRDFPVTFGRQFNCRGTFGLLVEFPVSCSSKLLTTLSTGHQNYTSTSRQSTRTDIIFCL